MEQGVKRRGDQGAIKNTDISHSDCFNAASGSSVQEEERPQNVSSEKLKAKRKKI